MSNITKPEIAPIVLFVYNRPWHTRQTLDALADNKLANESKLFIYCDGPKDSISQDDLLKIEETRQLVKKETRFKEVVVIESKVNKGLAKSIIDGVTEVVNTHGNVIVLEDDIITSKGFLKYMNDSLHVYKDEPEVMHISGYMYPVDGEMSETFFIKPTSCWGWATWSRAWKHFEKNVDEQIKKLEEINAWNEFTIEGSFPSYRNQLELNQKGIIDTWAIFWYASVFLKGGTSLHPYPSLAKNIGFDGSGENCGDGGNSESPYYWATLADEIKVHKKKKFTSKKEYNNLAQFFNKVNNPNRKELTNRDKFYLARQSIFNYLKNGIKIIALPNSYTVTKNDTINSTESEEVSIDRFVKGETTLFDKPVYYVDYPSYESTRNELFAQEIYKFNSSSDHPVIIDCGANIGLSIIYFMENYPEAEITAFEPDPEIFETLQKNMESFGYKNVKLIEKALWDEEGEVSFYAEGADGGRIDKSVHGEGKLITLKTTKLSSFIDQKIDFLKIDIEGAETKVLKECEHKLHLVDKLFVEYHSMENDTQTLSELLDILTRNGFRYYISSIGIKSPNPFVERKTTLGMDNQLNIFATRS